MPEETKSKNETLHELNKLSAAAKSTKAYKAWNAPAKGVAVEAPAESQFESIPVEPPAGRICSDPKCAHAGQWQPEEAFRGGYTICKKCHGRRAISARKAKKVEGKPEQKQPETAKETAALPRYVQEFKYEAPGFLDAFFHGFDQLLEELKKEADKEIRTPREQLLWIVRDRYRMEGRGV